MNFLNSISSCTVHQHDQSIQKIFFLELQDARIFERLKYHKLGKSTKSITQATSIKLYYF